MIKLFVTDIDGTLMADGTPVLNPAYYSAVEKLQERGIIFGVASGRQIFSIQRIFEPVKDDMLHIGENGAFGIYQGKELFHRPLTKEMSEEIVKDTRAMPGCMCMYDTRYVSYYEKGGEEVYNLMKDKFHYHCQMVDDLLELEETCLKFSVYRAVDVEKVTDQEFNPKWKKRVEVACGGTCFMDLVNRGVNKGSALRTVQEMLGIDPSETLVFGDNINDIEMLEAAEFSFAIGNARQEVKNTASYVGDDNQHDGVLKVMNTLIEGIDQGADIRELLKKYKK